MPVKASFIHPEVGSVYTQTLDPGDLWLVEEQDFDAEVTRIIAVYLPYEDYGAQVHALDPDEVDLEEFQALQEVPDDLIGERTQIGYVFANTYYKLPTNLAPECGRLLLRHVLSPRHTN